MKKKILTLMLTICFLITCSLSLTACGNAKKVYAWGKTFTYQGAYSTNYEQHENDAPTYKNLLKKEFEANNLDFQNAKIYISPIESSKTIDLTVASTIDFNAFISFINHEAFITLTSNYKDWKVEVGNKEDNCITINGKTYSLSQDDDEWNAFDATEYGILNDVTNTENKYLGRFDSILPSAINDYDSDYKSICLSFDGLYNFTITIPTKTPVNEDGYFIEESWDETTNTTKIISSSIIITFSPIFTIAE